MPDLFQSAVKLILEEEGIFSNQAGDPGGPTYYGIARASHPEVLPWPPTKEDAISIYRAGYWDAHRCGEMPWCWALGVFDGAVNQSASRVIRAAEAELGLGADGVVGNFTLARMHGANQEAFDLFMASRGVIYTTLPLFPTDGHGWLKRLLQVHHHALLDPPI